MFSEMLQLLIRDKSHDAKIRKISQLKANLSRKKFRSKENNIGLFSKYNLNLSLYY